MASASMFQDEFNCSICLDLLKDPVTVPCGHSFCFKCITGCWDLEDQKGVYSCPQCRQTFSPRPVLGRNTMMADMLEKLKKTELRSDALFPSDVEPGDVECDFCIGRKHKAIKSCLSCLLSYCELHIQPHYEVSRLSKHKLVKATSKLQERICSEHDRIIELFCREDQKLICMLCSMDDHSGHKTVSAAAERIKKQENLLEMKESNPVLIQQKEQEVEEVKQNLKSLQATTQKAVEDTEKIFTELISLLEQKRSEMTESIRAQERTEVSRAEELLEQLELEITKLKSRDAEIEKLQAIEDPVDFLQGFQSYFSYDAQTLSRNTFKPQFSFSEVMTSVAPSLREKTKEFHREILKVSGFMVGDTVKLRVPETVNKTCQYTGQRISHRGQMVSFGHGFGAPNNCGYEHNYSVLVNGVGVVTALPGPNNMTVSFPDHPGWNGSPSQLELVFTVN